MKTKCSLKTGKKTRGELRRRRCAFDGAEVVFAGAEDVIELVKSCDLAVYGVYFHVTQIE